MTAAPQMPPAVETQDLVRSFGHLRVLRGVSFAAQPGDVVAVFGPNGAGKTTLLRLLAGLLLPDDGAVRILGAPPSRGDARLRRRIGLISHHSLCYDGLTASENLAFYASLYRLEAPREAAQRALELVGLVAHADRVAGSMSRGMVQRLAIARALLTDPDVLLLDEPFTGLDQHSAARLREQLASLAAGRRTMILVTHNMDEGVELASHVAIMAGGRFAEYGPRRGDAAGWRARYAELHAGG